jgi:geranylgeranyl pyrophosphate synthase
MSKGKLIKQMQKLLREKGKKAWENAKKEVFCERIDYKPVRDALRYFIGRFWTNFHHPALITLACEAVGGNAENMTDIGAAMVLLTGAVDIHDDIIDFTEVKGSKPTLLGIFGRDIALITGNILLIKGLQLLNRACSVLSKEKGKVVFDMVIDGFLKLGIGVARETQLRGRWDITPEEYFEVIKDKAAIAETAVKIGAFLGGGSQKEINSMAEYGKILGVLATIRDDFIDMFEPNELMSRAKNECLPLPILYAFKNSELQKEIISLLEKEALTEEDTFTIVENVMKSKEIQELRKLMKMFLCKGIKCISFIKNKVIAEQLVDILTATLEDL